MAEDNSRGDNRLMFLLVGSAIGAAVGMLVAPRSGRETREQIKTKIKEQTEALQSEVKSAQEQFVKAKGKIEDETQRLLRRGKDFLGREQDSVAAAIDALKEAYLKEKESWDLKHQ